MYALFDQEGSRFDTPFYALNDIFAKRRFAMMVQQEDSPLHHFKNVFQLYCLGDFNVLTGEIQLDKYKVIEGLQITEYYKNQNKEVTINEDSHAA